MSPLIRNLLIIASLVAGSAVVAQATDSNGDGAALNVISRVHFNTNVSDFEASRAFYGQLGFETLSGFPDTNTIEMAQAIGITTPTSYDGSQGETAGGYLLHGELIGLGGFGGEVIDLIEFTIPRNEAAPYNKINHLGMAKAGIFTTDIEADYAYMSSLGIEFLAGITTRSNGERFAIFPDLDGTFYELIEVPGEVEDTETTHFTGVGRLNINVSDFDKSAAWYEMFGYELTKELPSTDSLAVAKAMGFDAPYNIKGAIFTHKIDDSTIELVQWITPYNDEPPYPIPVNHIGIHRTAFSTTDIEEDVAILKAQGVEFVSPVTPCCSGPDSWGAIVAFYDPDGTIVELVEQPIMTYMFRLTNWFSDLFG